MDLISVIIPVYNRETMIEECLRSVLGSSYRHLEVLVIDDGSTDGTLALCQKIQAQDDRIRILQGPHAGVSKARNMGLDAAVGQYIFFIDSDDAIHPELLELLHRGLVDTDAQMSATGLINIHQSKWHLLPEYIQKVTNPAQTEYVTNEEAIQRMFRQITPINLIGGVMMGRQLIGDTRFREDLFIGEDFYFIYENIIKGCSVVFTRAKLYYCRHHNNSSNNYSFDAFWSRFYRRVLVWQREEQLGRPDNVILQKADGFGCYLRCIRRHKPYSQEAKKMRKVLSQYRRTLSVGMRFTTKVRLYLALYTPALHHLLLRK